MKLIAIAGGSGSGKTTLANYLLKQNFSNACLISLDNYYLNENIQLKQNGFCNYDHPLSLDKELLIKNLKELQINGETEIPQYCFKQRDRIGYSKLVYHDTIVVEGLYAIEFLKELGTLKIFVDADIDLLLARRILRDIESRGRSVDSICSQYFNEVKPAYQDYIIHQKKIADIFLVNNFQDINDLISAIEVLISEMENE